MVLKYDLYPVMIFYNLLFLFISNLAGLNVSEQEALYYENYFEYYNLDGSLESTDQFHGCTVFISFWSKSCAPCIRSFDRYRDLREELINDGVIIINASIDNKDEWLWALDKYNPNGINVHPRKIQKLQRHFHVYFLPVYATLDIDGKLIEYNNSQKGNITQFAKWYKLQNQ